MDPVSVPAPGRDCHHGGNTKGRYFNGETSIQARDLKNRCVKTLPAAGNGTRESLIQVLLTAMSAFHKRPVGESNP